MNPRGMVLAAWLCCAAPLGSQAAWQDVPIPEGMQYARVICDTEQYLYCAFETADDAAGGLYRTSSQAPGAWEYLGFSGVPVHDVVEAAGSEQVLLVGTDDANKVYRSTDHGSTWMACGASLPGDRAIALNWNGGSPGRIYVLTWLPDPEGRLERISVSTDLGLSWTTVFCAGYSTNYLTCLASRGDGGPRVWKSIYTGYWTSMTFRSVDAGQTWSELPAEVGDGPPIALCAPLGSEWVYSLIPHQLYRWNNNVLQAFWTGPGFWMADMTTPAWWNGRVVMCGVTGNGRLRVAHRSEDEDAWTPLNEGLPDAISPSPDEAWWRFVLASGTTRPVLYYGTWTLGLWRLDLSDVVGVDDAAPVRMAPSLRVQPNPAGTMVRFSAEGMAGYPVEFQVVDVFGRQVASLRGSNGETTWDFKDAVGRAVPSGTYYVSVPSVPSAASMRLVHVR